MKDGAMTIVDGSAGDVIIEPDEATLKEYEQKRDAFLQHQKICSCLKGQRL